MYPLTNVILPSGLGKTLDTTLAIGNRFSKNLHFTLLTIWKHTNDVVSFIVFGMYTSLFYIFQDTIFLSTQDNTSSINYYKDNGRTKFYIAQLFHTIIAALFTKINTEIPPRQRMKLTLIICKILSL